MHQGFYVIVAVATDNQGHQRKSRKVQIVVGTPPMKRFEAEAGVWSGTGITVKSDAGASGGSYVNIAAQTGTGTWTIPNVAIAGIAPIMYSFRLPFDHPKDQFINVNGVRADTVRFDGALNTWLQVTGTVMLTQGSNTVQMELYWGWMDMDYIAIPVAVLTGMGESDPAEPFVFRLEQNYPNPFNPSTLVRYQLSVASKVELSIYDLLGREVATLVNDVRTPGAYNVTWNAAGLASGTYFCRLRAGTLQQTRKLLFVK
jgi:hypothetical protein